MSQEKIERILATYKPVEGRPGYVWVGVNTYTKLDTLREAYEEYFSEHEETGDTKQNNLKEF